METDTESLKEQEDEIKQIKITLENGAKLKDEFCEQYKILQERLKQVSDEMNVPFMKRK